MAPRVDVSHGHRGGGVQWEGRADCGGELDVVGGLRAEGVYPVKWDSVLIASRRHGDLIAAVRSGHAGSADGGAVDVGGLDESGGDGRIGRDVEQDAADDDGADAPVRAVDDEVADQALRAVRRGGVARLAVRRLLSWATAEGQEGEGDEYRTVKQAHGDLPFSLPSGVRWSVIDRDSPFTKLSITI